MIRINGKAYGEHRLVFLYFSGDWPPVVDHKDRNPSNNRFENLRAANKSTNAMNSKARNTYRGVSWCKRENKWRASIRSNNKQYSLGYHDKAEDAAKAYNSAAIEMHGEFANLNEVFE